MVFCHLRTTRVTLLPRIMQDSAQQQLIFTSKHLKQVEFFVRTFTDLMCNNNKCVLKPIAPSAGPEELSYSGLTSTSITLQWQLPQKKHHNGVIRYYIVNITEEETGHSFIFNTNNTNVTIDTLHPYYHYQFAVAAVTIATGPFLITERLQTAEDGKP